MSDTNAQIITLIRQAKLHLQVDDTKEKIEKHDNIDTFVSKTDIKENKDDNVVLTINFDKLVYDALFK